MKSLCKWREGPAIWVFCLLSVESWFLIQMETTGQNRCGSSSTFNPFGFILRRFWWKLTESRRKLAQKTCLWCESWHVPTPAVLLSVKEAFPRESSEKHVKTIWANLLTSKLRCLVKLHTVSLITKRLFEMSSIQDFKATGRSIKGQMGCDRVFAKLRN